jgi:gliding motility-associated-like protein
MQRLLFVLFFFSSTYCALFAQSILVEEATPQFTPEQLIYKYFLGDGIQVLNVKYEGPNLSTGHFENAKSVIGLEKGIVMSTGRVKTVKNGNQYLYGVDAPGNINADNNNASTVTDVDAQKLTKETPQNLIKYTITFRPSSDTLRFRYVFASEEYPEYACRDYNDLFGFFISGPGIKGTFENNGINIAKIPETDLPVTINNIHTVYAPNNCPAAYAKYYHDNNKSNKLPVFDGYLDVFTAEVAVQPCQTYTIKLVIADVGDKRLDSGVFLDAKSFGTNAVKVDVAKSNAVEGCSDAVVNFTLPSKKNVDYKIPLKIIGGTASQNTDYKPIMSEVVIKAGTQTATFSVQAIKDAIKEQPETIGIEYAINSCKKDTIWLNVRDNDLVQPDLGADKNICAGESVMLNATIVTAGNVSYEWFPKFNLDCGNCPIVNASPTSKTTYKVIVSDNYGCAFEDSIAIVVGAKMAAPIVTCEEATSNSVTFSWLPMTAVNLFEVSVNNAEWEDANNGKLGHKVTNLTTNKSITIQVRAKSNNKCKTANEIGTATCKTLDCVPPTLKVVNTKNESCHDNKDGKVTLKAEYGVAPYVYQFENQKNTVGEFMLIGAGKYVATVKDAKGCTAQVAFFITSPLPLVALPFAQDPTCNSMTNGKAALVVSGGTLPYQFTWTNGKKDSLLQQLTQGTFVGTVYDKNGCYASKQIVLTEKNALDMKAQIADNNCYGESKGFINPTIIGGTAPYQYQWSGTNNFAATEKTITNLKAGNYNITIIDGLGCKIVKNYTITAPSNQLLLTVSGSPTICFGEKGYAKSFVTGGSSPYQFAWSDGQKIANLDNLSPGFYTLTVTDAKGCVKKDTVNILGLEEIKATIETTAAACFNGNDGTGKILNLKQGDKSLNINDLFYRWSDGVLTSENKNLQGGKNYTVTISDKLGCKTVKSIAVGNPPSIDAKIEKITHATCYESNNGTATVIGIGGTAPYSYQWDNQTGGQKTANASSLKSGAYTVAVTDAKGCKIEKKVEITAPNKLKISFTPRNLTCKGDNSGKIESSIVGGTKPYTYFWNNKSTAPSIENLAIGTYLLTVTDAKGCNVVEQTKITEPQALDAKIETTNVTCFGGKNGRIMINPDGGTPPYKFSLNGSPFNGIANIIYLKSNFYDVTVKDVRGCLVQKTDVEITEPEQIAIALGKDTTIAFGDTLKIGLFKKGFKGQTFQYNWNKRDSMTMSCLDCAAPLVFPIQSTNYQLKVTDSKGCTASAQQQVHVNFSPKIFVPTGFSPNSDGQNDVLMVHGDKDIKILYFVVYDRWGGLLVDAKNYHINDEKGVWDGTFKSKKMPVDAYIWGMEVEYPTGQRETMKGSITLLVE